ncbi:polyhedrin [Operophtera brumata reovirus]|uniref:polyhedrin n=1 Tax=Operophtera brumata reovirus TaxID=352248 RepID=UPI00005D6839|nr:polyhedrin [Operophtera brumata reovirus]ABB17208.1 polyhedrin [Operophtera brumata reovirus]
MSSLVNIPIPNPLTPHDDELHLALASVSRQLRLLRRRQIQAGQSNNQSTSPAISVSIPDQPSTIGDQSSTPPKLVKQQFGLSQPLVEPGNFSDTEIDIDLLLRAAIDSIGRLRITARHELRIEQLTPKLYRHPMREFQDLNRLPGNLFYFPAVILPRVKRMQSFDTKFVFEDHLFQLNHLQLYALHVGETKYVKLGYLEDVKFTYPEDSDSVSVLPNNNPVLTDAPRIYYQMNEVGYNEILLVYPQLPTNVKLSLNERCLVSYFVGLRCCLWMSLFQLDRNDLIDTSRTPLNDLEDDLFHLTSKISKLSQASFRPSVLQFDSTVGQQLFNLVVDVQTQGRLLLTTNQFLTSTSADDRNLFNQLDVQSLSLADRLSNVLLNPKDSFTFTRITGGQSVQCKLPTTAVMEVVPADTNSIRYEKTHPMKFLVVERQLSGDRRVYVHSLTLEDAARLRATPRSAEGKSFDDEFGVEYTVFRIVAVVSDIESPTVNISFYVQDHEANVFGVNSEKCRANTKISLKTTRREGLSDLSDGSAVVELEANSLQTSLGYYRVGGYEGVFHKLTTEPLFTKMSREDPSVAILGTLMYAPQISKHGMRNIFPFRSKHSVPYVQTRWIPSDLFAEAIGVEEAHIEVDCSEFSVHLLLNPYGYTSDRLVNADVFTDDRFRQISSLLRNQEMFDSIGLILGRLHTIEETLSHLISTVNDVVSHVRVLSKAFQDATNVPWWKKALNGLSSLTGLIGMIVMPFCPIAGIGLLALSGGISMGLAFSSGDYVAGAIDAVGIVLSVGLGGMQTRIINRASYSALDSTKLISTPIELNESIRQTLLTDEGLMIETRPLQMLGPKVGTVGALLKRKVPFFHKWLLKYDTAPVHARVVNKITRRIGSKYVRINTYSGVADGLPEMAHLTARPGHFELRNVIDENSGKLTPNWDSFEVDNYSTFESLPLKVQGTILEGSENGYEFQRMSEFWKVASDSEKRLALVDAQKYIERFNLPEYTPELHTAIRSRFDETLFSNVTDVFAKHFPLYELTGITNPIGANNCQTYTREIRNFFAQGKLTKVKLNNTGFLRDLMMAFRNSDEFSLRYTPAVFTS